MCVRLIAVRTVREKYVTDSPKELSNPSQNTSVHPKCKRRIARQSLCHNTDTQEPEGKSDWRQVVGACIGCIGHSILRFYILGLALKMDSTGKWLLGLKRDLESESAKLFTCHSMTWYLDTFSPHHLPHKNSTVFSLLIYHGLTFWTVIWRNRPKITSVNKTLLACFVLFSPGSWMLSWVFPRKITIFMNSFSNWKMDAESRR